MATIKQLRELFPALSELNDEDLFREVGSRAGLPAERVAQLYGDPTQAELDGDFITGVKAGWNSMKAAGAGAVGLAGAASERMFGVGEGLRDWGIEGYLQNMEKVNETYRPDVYDVEGAFSSPGNFIDATQYYAGRVLPDAATALVSGGLGAAVGKRLVSEGVEAAVQRGAKDLLGDRIGSKVTRGAAGSVAGVTAQATAQETGAIYGQAVNEAVAGGGTAEDVDLGRAVGFGLAAGAMESAGDVLTLGAARLGPVKNLLDAADSPNRFVRAGTRGGTAAGVEALTEGVQSGLGDMGAGRTFEDAGFMDPTAMFAGAVGGGTIGGAGGLISPGPAQRAPAPDVGSQAQLAAENAELARMAQEAEAQQDDAKRELRDQFAPTFMSLDEFGKQRAKRLEAEALDPSTETGAAFTEWRKANDEYLTDAATTKRLTKAFLKEYAADDPGATKADYLAALDEHAERMQAMAAEFSGEAETDSAREGKTEDTTGLANMGSDMAGAMADGYVDMLLSRHTAGEVTDASGTRSPTLMVADAVRNRGVDVDFDTMRGIARSVDKIMELPASERAGAANALVAQYGRPSKKTAKPKPTQEAQPTQEAKPQKPKRMSKKDQARPNKKTAKPKPTQEAQPTQEAKPQKPKRMSKKDQARADAEARRGPNWEVDHPDLSFMVEDGKSIYPARKGEQPKFWRRLDEIDREQAEAEEKPAEKTEKAEKPVASEEGEVDAKDVLGDIGRRATEYAEQKLGPDWRKIDKDLEELLKKRRFAAFNRRVDELAPAQESTQSLVAKREEAPSPPTVDVNVDGLSVNEKKVWDVIRNAFANNDQDSVIQVDGKWNATKIAELAGIKSRQAAHVAITRLKPKIAKRFGVKPDEIASRLRATRVKGGEAAASFDDAQEVFDPSELREGAGFGTKASIDQGAHEGLTKEDIAYSKGRSEEPNPIADQRAEKARAYRTRLENAAKETYGALAVRAWGQLSAEGDVPFAQLSERDQTDWVMSFSEYAEKRMSAEQLVADQRDTARLYDAEGGVTMEELDAQDAEKAALAGPASRSPEGGEGVSEGGRPDTGETRGDRGRDDGEGDRPARPVAEASEQEAEIAGAEALDTGVVGEQKARPKVEVRKARKVNKRRRFSYTTGGDPTTVGQVEDAANEKWGPRITTLTSLSVDDDGDTSPVTAKRRLYPGDDTSVVQVHQTVRQAARALKGRVPRDELEIAQAVVDPLDGRVHMIADNIAAGTEEAVLLHEVGVHVGVERKFSAAQIDRLASEVNAWKDAAEGSIERRVFEATQARMAFARLTGLHHSLVGVETVAYAVEEAVKLGVQPSSKARSRVAKWLASVADMFKSLIVRKDAGEVAITAEELVALADGLAAGAMKDSYVEAGAITKDQGELVGYYTGLNPGDDIPASAKVVMDQGLPGQEVFYWEDGARVGPFTDIRTELDWYVEPGYPGPVGVMNVYSGDLEDPIITLTLVSDPTMVATFELTITGPELDAAQAAEVLGAYSQVDGVDQETWSRLEGVSRSQLTRILREGRRRLTRTTKGVAPNITFHRVTGSAINGNGDARPGVIPHWVAARRFSLVPPQDLAAAASESAASQRSWATTNFGGSRTTQMIDDAKDIWAGASNSLKPMSRFIRDVAEEMPSAKAWNDALLEAKQTRRQWSGIVDEIANRARQLAPERRALVNDFLAASTIYQKWGYDPKIDGKKVKVDPLMARKFARLTAEEQQVVRDIFQHGDNVRAEMDKTAKDLGIDKLFTFQSRLDGPYAPLKRFGDSVVVLRSQELLDAEAALAEDSTKANRDAVEKLKSNGEHYVVKFFDTMGAAKKFVRANEGKYASATASKKAPDATPMSGDNTRAYQKVLAALNAHDASKLPADSKKVVQDLVKGLYFQSLDEKSARLSGAQRLNREGYDKDMIRSFVSHGRSQATLLAQMKHGGAINGALIEARNESRRGNNQEKLRNVYRVIAAKNRALLTPRSGLLAKIEDHVLAANTTWMLSTNIGYHVTNRLQPLWSIAKIGGDLNAYTSAWRHFLAGTKIGRKVVNTSFLRQLGTVVTAGAVDLNNKLEINVDAAPEQYRNLLRTMQLRDLLDVGLEEDLNIENRLDTGYATLNKVGDFYRNLTHRLYQVARYVEASNRVASAIAAFDTARSHPQALRRMKMTPEEYAIGVIQDTQGDFSAEETPLLLSKLPRTTTQFRKFQVMMAWLHADALKRTFSPNTPAHERAAAIRTTAYLFATTGFMAGTIGLPAANLAAMAFQMAFGDDDEPKDLEFYIRDKIGDPQLATLVARGVPAFLGVDMSTRMSLNDIFQPWNERYASPSTEREGALAFTSQIILGPTSGQVANIAQAVGRLQEGDIARGVEYLAPKGIRSMMSSLRLASEGMETRSGVVAADPREFDLFDLITNATGLPSSFVTNLYWTRGQQYELKEHFSNETSRLKAAYWDAYRDRDRARMKELREEFRELQKAKRRVAPFFHGAKDAPKPQPISSLTNTPRERRRQSREAQRAVGLR